jgi:hypothetical protein
LGLAQRGMTGGSLSPCQFRLLDQVAGDRVIDDAEQIAGGKHE